MAPFPPDTIRPRGVYLDYNATAPVDPRVVAAMAPFHTIAYGSASSRDHAFGWDAADAVEEARIAVAGLIGASASEVYFTSGATESVNLALRATLNGTVRGGTVTSPLEHDAVLQTCKWLERSGSPTLFWQVDGTGTVIPNSDHSRVEPQGCGLAALMLANNEVGTVQPVASIVQQYRTERCLIFSDLTQAVGRVPVDIGTLGVDLAAFSAHKLCGPKGIGALFVRSGGVRSIEIEPLIFGGGQERGLRAGTHNVPAIVGFGEACRIAGAELRDEATRIVALRDGLEHALVDRLGDVWINGGRANRLPNTSNIGFAGIDARELIRVMDDIAVSTRSACSTHAQRPSHVLKAMGLSDDDAYSSVRFSLGRFTNAAELDYAIEKVVSTVRRLRAKGWRRIDEVRPLHA